MHRLASLALMMATAALAGCSSGSGGLSTGSIFGSTPTPPAAGAAPAVALAPASTPTDRAFQVGSVSARAVKCGYNFDAQRLKAAYLAHEIGVGAGNTDMARIEKIYDVAYTGVLKAAAAEPDYCSGRKTDEIKADLTRLLAGDFDPPRRQVAAKQADQGGLFSGWFDGSSSQESGPSWGSGDWWENQREKVGN